jgi:hypothetical protein
MRAGFGDGRAPPARGDGVTERLGDAGVVMGDERERQRATGSGDHEFLLRNGFNR